MAYCGEQTRYITPCVPIFLIPFSSTNVAPHPSSLSSASCVSIIVSNYRLRVCHIISKNQLPLDIPLTMIESIRRHRAGDFTALAVKSKSTFAFRLVVVNITGNTVNEMSTTASSVISSSSLLSLSMSLPFSLLGGISHVNPTEVLLNLLQAIEAAIPRTLGDFFAFAYFSALRRNCAHKAQRKQKQETILNSKNSVKEENEGKTHNNNVKRNNNSASSTNINSCCCGSCTTNSTVASCEQKKEENILFNIRNNSFLPHVKSLNCIEDEKEDFSRNNKEKGDSLLLGFYSGKHQKSQMRRSSSAVLCDSMMRVAGISHNNNNNNIRKIDFSNKEKDSVGENSFRIGLLNNVEDRYSIVDGGFQYDSAWYAYNLENDFHRMTRISSSLKKEYPNDLNNNNNNKLPTHTTLNSPTLGVDISSCFHIIPLTKSDLFATYPFSIIVPQRVTITLAERVAQYRHHGRIPSISWIHLETGASISRASQPGSGSYMSSDADVLFCSFLNSHLPQRKSQEKQEQEKGFGVYSQQEEEEIDNVSKNNIREENLNTNEVTQIEEDVKDVVSSSNTINYSNDNQIENQVNIKSNNNSNKFSDTVKRKNEIYQQQTTKNINSSLLSNDVNLSNSFNKISEKRQFHIIDCRSRAAAAANFATGGGYEIVRNYENADIQFLGLDNIHSVRSAFNKLGKLCIKLQRHEIENITEKKCPSNFFYSSLDSTKWPEMIINIIWSSWLVTEKIVSGESVLVHCTDGWDRTSQVVSLAMLQLDGYYRTIEGFCILIMREWLEMGHRFSDRCGNNQFGDDTISLDAAGEDDNPAVLPKGDQVTGFATGINLNYLNSKSTQVSPIFIQFIDAVYQLLRLFPSDFEFTPYFLHYLLEEVYSCRFGNFLYNCHRSRYRRGGITSHTASFWGEVEELVRFERENIGSVPANEKLINPFYIPLEAYELSNSLGNNNNNNNNSKVLRSKYLIRRLIPNFMSSRYNFWQQHYFRYSFTDILNNSNGSIGLEPEYLVPLIDSWLWHNNNNNNKQNIILPNKEKDEIKEEVENKSKNEKNNRLRSMFPGRVPILSNIENELNGTQNLIQNNQQNVLTPSNSEQRSILLDVPNNNITTPNSSSTGISYGEEIDSGSDSSFGGGKVLTNSYHKPLNSNSTLTFCVTNSSDAGMMHRIKKGDYIIRSKSKSCEVCAESFTFFFRRHACRHCGRAVCSRCGGRFVRLPSFLIRLYEERDKTHPVRICSICYSKVVHYVTTSQRQL